MLFYQRKNPWRPFIFWQKKAASSTTIVIMIFRMTIQNRWFSETVFSSWPVVSKNIEDKFDQPNHYTELKAKFYIQSVAFRKALYEWSLYLYLLFSISSGVIHKFFFFRFLQPQMMLCRDKMVHSPYLLRTLSLSYRTKLCQTKFSSG